ncbi:MAG: isopentenyl transferase family protein, partial [Chitinivibrionales bacterium]
MKKNSIVICGPTATGKTSLAAEIAYNTGSEIISADSRQVYRHMDIGTGKDLDEYTINRTRIPFHLIDITNPSNIYTLYHYQQDFYTTFSKISSEGKIPVISG